MVHPVETPPKGLLEDAGSPGALDVMVGDNRPGVDDPTSLPISTQTSEMEYDISTHLYPHITQTSEMEYETS